MSVTVVVETGSGLDPTANSYISVADADAYISANIIVNPVWAALSPDDQAALVVWSTRYLDQHAFWNGSKTLATSPLRWPRTGVNDADGNPIGNNTIPLQLVQATAELARFLMIEDRTVERTTDGLIRLKVDVIELGFEATYRLPQIPMALRFLIEGLGFLRGGTGSFGRIRAA